MAVEKDVTRKAVNIAWDKSTFADDAVLTLRASNADDVSLRTDLKNDGFATVTYAHDYHGESHIDITDEDGNLEEGDITV